MRSRQQGITLIGFLIVLAVGGFFAYLAMRLVPVYSEYYSVVTALKGLQQEPGMANQSPEEIREALFKRFDIGYVESVKREHVKISKDRGVVVQVTYEVRRPLMYNIDFVASFDKSVDLMNSAP